MSKSELEKKSQRDYSGALRSPSEQAAFMDGMMHLLEVAEKWALEHGAGDIGSGFGSRYDYADLRDYLKSYCGRE